MPDGAPPKCSCVTSESTTLTATVRLDETSTDCLAWLATASCDWVVESGSSVSLALLATWCVPPTGTPTMRVSWACGECVGGWGAA